MIVQDIDVAHTIWGKNIDYLKGKTARKKLIHVEGGGGSNYQGAHQAS